MKYFKLGIQKATTNSSNVNPKIYILRFIITSMLNENIAFKEQYKTNQKD